LTSLINVNELIVLPKNGLVTIYTNHNIIRGTIELTEEIDSS